MQAIQYGINANRGGLNVIRFGPRGAGIDADAAAYIAAMTTTPDATRQGLINDLVKSLKADGVWSSLQWLSLAMPTAQASRVNAINPAQVASAVNSPTFTADRGYQGDGSTSYLDTAVAGTVLTDTDCSLFAFVDILGSDAAGCIIGYNAGTGSLRASTANSLHPQAYLVSSTAASFSPASTMGNDILVVGTRTGTTALTYRNSTASGAPATVATNTSGQTANILALRSGGFYSNSRLSVFGFGKHLTAAQVSALNTHLRTYLTAIGAL